jgi:hypothetical protein
VSEAQPSEHRKGKRKAGERVEWSADEADDAYERFKNRAATKRKKIATTKKKIKAKAKDAAASREQGRAAGESVSTKEKVWGEDSDYELMEEQVPEYLQSRRKKFERGRAKLEQGGLRLPPTWEDFDFSDDDRLEELDERPHLPNVKTSRRYEDITLPKSLGVIPASIAQYLRDYQIKGVAFLHELFVST